MPEGPDSQVLGASDLSTRERQVVLLSMSGLGDKEVAVRMGIGFETVRTYWQRIRKKVGARTRAEIIALLVQQGSAVAIDEQATQVSRLVQEIAQRKEAEERFKAVAEDAPIGVLISGPDGDCLFVNGEWQRITGLTPDQALGKGWMGAVHKEDRPQIVAGWSKVRRGKTRFNDVRFVLPNGSIVWGHILVSQMKVEGVAIGTIATLEDVTERRRLESELRESEARFRTFMDHLPGTASIKDEEGRLTYANKGFDRLLGFPSELLLGKRDDEYFSPDVAKQNQADDHTVRETGQPVAGLEVRRSLRGTRTFLSQKFSLEGPQRARLVGSVSMDVTEMWDSEQKLRAAAETSFDAVMILKAVRDASGSIEDFEFTFTNDVVPQYLGISAKVLAGRTIREISQSDPTTMLLCGLARSVETREPFHAEFLSSLPGLQRRWLTCQAQSVGETVILTVRDIHEERISRTAAAEQKVRLDDAERRGRVGRYEHDWTTGLTVWSASLIEMFEIPADGAAGFDWFESLIHPEDVHTWRERRDECARNHLALDEHVRVKTTSGKVLHIHSVGVYLVDEQGNLLKSIATVRDETQEWTDRSQADEQVRHLQDTRLQLEIRQQELMWANGRLAEFASMDSLTALHNHGALRDRLLADVSISVRHSLDLSLILLDIDDFKAVNDTHGHPAGDAVLKGFAKLLQKSMRQGDFLARYGGEEFAVILPLTDLAGAVAVARKLRAAIEAEGLPHGPMTASFGCAQLSQGCDDAAQLVEEADQALYAAKRQGRNTVQAFEPISCAVVKIDSSGT